MNKEGIYDWPWNEVLASLLFIPTSTLESLARKIPFFFRQQGYFLTVVRIHTFDPLFACWVERSPVAPVRNEFMTIVWWSKARSTKSSNQSVLHGDSANGWPLATFPSLSSFASHHCSLSTRVSLVEVVNNFHLLAGAVSRTWKSERYFWIMQTYFHEN